MVRPADIQRTTGLGVSYSISVKRGAVIPDPRLYRLLAGVTEIKYPFGILACPAKEARYAFARKLSTGSIL
jgi:hypothetical protein